MAYVKINGVRMTTEQRNVKMRLEYVTMGASVEDLAENYHLSVPQVEQLRRKDKWASAKKKFTSESEEMINDSMMQVYAGFKAQFNIQYNDAWQRLMDIVNMCLNEPLKYLFYKNGMPKIAVLDALASIIERAQKGQGDANGVMLHEVAVKLEMQREKLIILQNREVNTNNETSEQEQDAITKARDNFINALNQAGEDVWAQEEMPEELKAVVGTQKGDKLMTDKELLEED